MLDEITLDTYIEDEKSTAAPRITEVFSGLLTVIIIAITCHDAIEALPRHTNMQITDTSFPVLMPVVSFHDFARSPKDI